MSTPGQAPLPVCAPPAAPRPKGSNTVLIVAAIGLAFVALLAVGGVLAMRALAGPELPSEAEIPQILKEAAGTAPRPAQDTPARKAIRDAFSFLLTEQRTFTASAAEHAGNPAMNHLMQPDSYVMPPIRQEVLAELHALRDLDTKHISEVERFPQVLKANLAAAQVPVAQQDAFDEGVRKGWGENMDRMRKTTETEIAWLDATIALYDYAEENSPALGLTEAGELVIADEGIRAQFNDRLSRAEELRQKTVAAGDEFDKKQQQQRQKMGISEQDLGH